MKRIIAFLILIVVLSGCENNAFKRSYDPPPLRAVYLYSGQIDTVRAFYIKIEGDKLELYNGFGVFVALYNLT